MTTRVLVSVGTHEQAFQRLLDGVREIVPLFRDIEFVVQFGVGWWPATSKVEAVPYFTHDDMRRQLLAADILITQASPGNIFSALDADTWPLVLGRSGTLREHVDDHQIHFASTVQRLGLGINIEEIGRLSDRLSEELASTRELRVEKCRNARAESAERASTFYGAFWENIDVLMGIDNG